MGRSQAYPGDNIQLGEAPESSQGGFLSDKPMTNQKQRHEVRYELPALSTRFTVGISGLLINSERFVWALCDALSVAIACTFASWLSPWQMFGRIDPRMGFVAALTGLLYAILGLAFGHYERRFLSSFMTRALRSCFLAATSMVLTLILFYFIEYELFGRYIVVFGVTFGFIATTIIDGLVRIYLYYFPYRFTVIGDSAINLKIKSYYKLHGRRAKTLSYHDSSSLIGQDKDAAEMLHGLLDARILDVVINPRSLNRKEMRDLVIQGLRTGIKFYEDVDFYSLVFEQIPPEELSSHWVLRRGLNERTIFRDGLKRLFDFTVASSMLLLLSPFLALVALLIKLTSKGPVIFVQERMGYLCRPFKMYKFRSMTEEASALQNQKFTEKNDPRITLIGRFMRTFHIDELPQLWNVIRGDMSLVGPRPEALAFANRMTTKIPFYEIRYMVRPGLTGLAQLRQGYALDTVEDTHEKLSYDLYYLQHRGLRFDLLLMFRTVFLLAFKSR